MKPKALTILLLGIILLGLFLRLYQLDIENLWQDEGFTLMEVDRPTLKDSFLAVWGPPEGTPPFYFLLLHLWVRVGGSSDFNLRLPSVIFGVISISLLFLVGKELFGVRTALMSAFIMSISMLQILYSQEARAYSLFVLLTLLSVFFFIKVIKNSKSKYFMGYFISALLLLYTHHFGLFIILIQNLIYFALYFQSKGKFYAGSNNLEIKKWVRGNFLLGLLYLPGVILIFSQFQHNQRSLQSALIDKLGLPAFIGQLGIWIFLLPVLLLLVGMVFYHIKRTKENHIEKITAPKINLHYFFEKIKLNGTFFFLLITIFSVVYVYLLPQLVHPFFATRFTVFLYPFFYLLMAYGFTKLNDKKLRQIITIIFLVAAVSSLFFYYGSVKKPQWQEAVSLVEEESQLGELIIILGQSKLAIFNHYYKSNLEMMGVDVHVNPSENEQELQHLISRPGFEDYKGYWLIQSEAYKTKGIYKKYFENRTAAKEEKRFYQVEVGHYGKMEQLP